MILPITDPYVVHHGALGSFATVYLPAGTTAEAMAAKLKAHARHRGGALQAARPPRRFELPADRLGDLVVVSTKHKVLGTSASRHDLSGLDEPLRTMAASPSRRCRCSATASWRPMLPTRHWRNFDAFDLALNLVA